MSASFFSIIAILGAVSLAAAATVPRRQRTLNGALLAAGLVLMAILEGADRYALNNPEAWQTAKQVSVLCEALLGAAWLLFAATYARSAPFRQFSPFTWGAVLLAALLPLVPLLTPATEFYFSPDFADEHVLFLGSKAYWFYLGAIVLAVIALYRLERALMALPSLERALVLYELLGVGIVLTALLVYYSQALLHRTIDMNLVPLRSLAILLGVALCGYSRVRRGSARRIEISRDVASRSAVVLVVGAYLLLLGGAGEVLRYFGPHNQRLIFIGLAVLSGLCVILLLLSDKNRRKLKVFLHKHFYRHKYDYRSEWLMFTRQLSSADDMARIQTAILDFYCETFARKGAALYLRDTDSGTYQQKANRYLDFPQACIYPDHPLVGYFNETDWVFNTADPHDAPLDAVRRQLAPFRVELCVPLQYEQDLEGFILLGEAANPGETLNYEDFDLMKMLASQATSVLLSLKLTEQLSTAQEMAAIGRVSTFVIHDLKNHVSNLSLMLDNAREHMANPEFQQDMLETLDETVGKMNGLIARLKHIKEKKELNLAPCDLGDVVSSGVRAAGSTTRVVRNGRVPVVIDAAEIEKVVHNLVLNAHDAGARNGAVQIEVGMAGMAYFEVVDQGCGMSEQFMQNRLFRPFQTTKQNGFGIGLYQCRQIIEAHGGKVEVASKEGEGTRFRVHLPAADRGSAAHADR